MKVEQKALDDHQVRLTVEVEAEQLSVARRKAARQIAGRIKVPGFRPGKAPYNVIEKQVGPEAIQEEALDIVLDDIYPKLLEESGIDPWGAGTLEKVHEDKEPPVFEIRVPLSPTVELGNYQKVRIPFKEKPVTKKDIQGVIDNLREQQAVLKPVEREAQEGDMVYVQMSAERLKPDKDGETALIKERRYPVVVEAKAVDASNEWPYPGFSRALIGLKAGEEKQLSHTFSKDSEFEDLRGEAATFQIKVDEIKDRVLPEGNDEFAKSLGEYADLAALEADIKNSLTENYEQQSKDDYETSIVEKVVADSKIKFPPQMLDHEVEHYIEDLGPQLAQQGLDMDTYLKTRQITMQDLKDEVRPSVEERLKKSLTIMEVSRQEKIEVSEQAIQELVQARVQRLQELTSEEETRKALTGEALQGLVSRTMTEEVINRTLARLREIAQGGKAEAKAKDKTKAETKAETTDKPKAKKKATTKTKDKE